MRIFLAGATGAIGRLLLPHLVEAGHEVTGTTRSAAKSDQIKLLGGQPIVMDALDRQALIKIVAAARPDVIINMMTDLNGRDFAANSRLRIEGSRNLVDAALAAGVQKLIAETISWIYAAGNLPAHENEPLDSEAPDGRGRSVAAVQALEGAVAEMPVGIVLRFGILYGPGTWYTRDSLTTEQLRRGELVANDAVNSFIHVADAAQAAFQALGWPAGAYNIVDDEPATKKEWMPYYARLVGAPAPVYKAGAEAWERGESNAKARQQGWQPIYPSWREGFSTELGSLS